jgi:hypothetical protein
VAGCGCELGAGGISLTGLYRYPPRYEYVLHREMNFLTRPTPTEEIDISFAYNFLIKMNFLEIGTWHALRKNSFLIV